MSIDISLGNVYGLLAVEVARCREIGRIVAVVIDVNGNLSGIDSRSPGFDEAVSSDQFVVMVSSETSVSRIAERIKSRLVIS